jgi:hypothetical protein
MGFTRANICWGSIGVAGICVSVGVALILRERGKERERRKKGLVHGLHVRSIGVVLVAVALLFTLIALECFSWPG